MLHSVELCVANIVRRVPASTELNTKAVIGYSGAAERQAKSMPTGTTIISSAIMTPPFYRVIGTCRLQKSKSNSSAVALLFRIAAVGVTVAELGGKLVELQVAADAEAPPAVVPNEKITVEELPPYFISP